MNKKSVRDVEVEGKRVFCRVDFNVPMEDGQIIDDTRIRAALPTIDYLIERRAKIILASHLGRPKGQVVESLRLDPVADRLQQLIGKNIHKVNEAIGSEVEERIAIMEEGDILLLENVRFYPGEEKNDVELAKKFARLADVYVNDAFGAAHRAHASTEGIAHFLLGVSGLLMETELDYLGSALTEPKRPFTAIIGGAKVKDKIGVIEHLLEKVDHLILGGGLANTFIKAGGHELGKSLLEEDKIELAKSLMDQAKQKGVRLHLPVDCVVADKFANDANTRIVPIDSIPADFQVLDIGPKTIENFSDVIGSSKLVIWNGPMGVFEMESFATGTNGVAKALANSRATTIIGGGDSAAAIEKAGLSDEISHISTGGGASLEFMEGKQLPGVVALQNRVEF